MNRLHLYFVFLALALVAAHAEESNAPSGVTSNALPVTITIDGTIYENVRWESVTPSTVTIFHKTGVATIPLKALPPELQKRFGYAPQKDAEWQSQQLKQRQAWQQKAEFEKLKNTPLTFPFKVGMIGTSPEGISVVQVIDANNMRAHIYTKVYRQEFVAAPSGLPPVRDMMRVPTQGITRWRKKLKPMRFGYVAFQRLAW